LLIGCAVFAQPPRPVVETGDTTLYLVLRVGPDITEKDILKTLKQGLELSLSSSSGEPSIKAVSPAFFEEFQKLVDRAGPPVAAADEGLSIRVLPARELIYEIKVQPTQVLKKLRVTYQRAGVKEYTPTAPDGKSPLILIVPGRYAFIPEADDAPLKYEGDVAELGKANLPAIAGEWPKGDKYFVVTMRNFSGNRKRLFEVITDKNKVANPLDHIQLESDLIFAFASLNSTAADPGDEGIDPEHNITITVETIPSRNPRRAWVYFPLEEKAAKEAAATFRKFDSVQITDEIRKNAVRFVDRKQVAVVGSKDEARWIELPAEFPNPDPKRFTRKVKIDDLPEFVDRYPHLWMLVVWEFDNGKPEAIQVKHPVSGDRVSVLELERSGWQKATQKVPKPKK
jgi:hypothetical protein